MVVGLVPEIEERETANALGYTWPIWLALDYWERVSGLAHWRIHQLIDKHTSEAVELEGERRAKVRSSNGRH